jgi:glycosyltransferase involved in cell wall biosynthesis
MVVTNPVVSDPRVEREAAALARAGHEFSILAGDRAGGAPEGEARDGYVIERLGPRAGYGAGIRTMPAFLGFWRAATARALELEPDVVHCHDLDTATVGLRILRKRPGTRLVADFHEMYSESRMVPRGALAGAVARAYIARLERRTVRDASAVIVVSPPMAPHYESLGASGKLHVIENAPDAEALRPHEPAPGRPFTVCYAGQKRYAASLRLLMGIVQRHDGMAALLAGGGVAQAEIESAAASMRRVETLGPFTKEDLPAIYARADAVWGVYDSDIGNIRVAMPVKVLEGMACGLPVLVDAGTYIADVVTRHGCGLAVDGSDFAAVEVALVGLAQDPDTRAEMGRRGRAVVDGGLSWQAVSRRLVNVYDDL